MKKIIGIIIIIAVLSVTAYLILHIPKQGRSKLIEPTVSSFQSSSEEWLGIFIQEQRVGYSFTKMWRTDTGLVVENVSQMTLLMMGAQRTLITHLFAHTDNEFTLKNFQMEIETEGHVTKVEGTIEGTQLMLTTYSRGIPTKQVIALKEKPYFPDAIEEVIKRKDLKPGDEISIPYFDPTTQSSSTATIKMFGKENVTVLGVEKRGMRVEIDYIGIQSILWLDDEYKLLKESSPAMGLEMIPLSKEEALAEIRPDETFDLLSFFSVKLDTVLPDPQTLTYLKLELRDITAEGLDLNDDYQVLNKADPITIELFLPQLADLPDLRIPVREHEAYLQPSAYIQCSDPAIIAKAKEIVGDEKNAQKVVGRLVEGVYNFIEKNPIASLPSALDVLQTQEGDCNEHAILFTALARACGMPTKIYVGLVNLHGFAYYYHAWCAVWLGKWVPVDPTFNQYPADVGHLKLKEGEISEQANVLKVVGKLKIDVLEYRE